MTSGNDDTTTNAGTRPRAITAAVLIAAVLALGPAGAVLAQDEDPDLQQTIEADQEIVAGEPAVLDIGHVDIGPRFADGVWTLLIHDDSARADPDIPSVWRYPDDTVFQVGDAAVLQVPDDETYDFIGAEPGADVYVVPQTQHPEVVWVGWNTQDPEVMETIDRGVTMSLTGVQGPGSLVVYLQSGSFEPPDVLWDSKVAGEQPAWVAVNTHAHANWVFTEPGVYLVQMEVTAGLIDGSAVSDTRELRFAVGDGTPVEDAFAAEFAAPQGDADVSEGDSPVITTAPVGGTGAESDGDGGEGTGSGGTAVIVAIALALGAAFLVLTMRGRSAKRRASDSAKTRQ